jgi:hypothetical protein
MKLTKDRFTNWEDIDEDYDILLDDELIISIKPEERSRDIADYILGMQDEIIQLRVRIKQLESWNDATPL